MLCPKCSMEQGDNDLPKRPSGLISIVTIPDFCILLFCSDCAQFIIKRHPKYRNPFYTALPGGPIKLPKGCLSLGTPLKTQ